MVLAYPILAFNPKGQAACIEITDLVQEALKQLSWEFPYLTSCHYKGATFFRPGLVWQEFEGQNGGPAGNWGGNVLTFSCQRPPGEENFFLINDSSGED